MPKKETSEPGVIPGQVLDPQLRDYLEVMSTAVFQAGLRWAAIAKTWDAYVVAFDAFEPLKVASYTEFDVERLMETPRVLHSAKKIRATIHNAQTLLALDRERGGFQHYLRSFENYDAFSKDFRKRFKFMGEMNVWYFLFRVNEPVPEFEHWVTTIQGDHPRMKEMVEKGRKAGTSREY
ncbi:MAG: DNA-3-methyladenine glycosylase I [Candidatus Baltobacteraceae bacterium]